MVFIILKKKHLFIEMILVEVIGFKFEFAIIKMFKLLKIGKNHIKTIVLVYVFKLGTRSTVKEIMCSGRVSHENK